jgi:hypothetical protein
MANGANGKWIGLGVGDVDDPATPRTAPNWNAITLLTDKLNRNFTWAREMGIVKQPNYDTTVAAAVERYCTNPTITLPVVRDAQGYAVANLAMRTRLGSYPPPAPPTHAMFTSRGTGGEIGIDYTSQIAQALRGLYHEHPILTPATMGGIPVGVAGAGPSGNECAELACDLLADAVLGSTLTFAVAGYSLGTKGVVMFLNRLHDPEDALYEHRGRLVCAVLIADPWRPRGRSFYRGPVPSGQGIGSPYFTMSKAAQDALGWRCCWLTRSGDLYANAPIGGTGMVLADIEQIVLGTDLADPLSTIRNAIPYILRLIERDGGLQTLLTGGAGVAAALPGAASPVLGGLAGAAVNPGALLSGVAAGSVALTPALMAFLLPVLESAFTGLVDGVGSDGVDMPAGIGADVQAAILALRFYGSGIQAHVSYHNTPWGHGPQTYLQLAIQHAADYGSRVPVAT